MISDYFNDGKFTFVILFFASIAGNQIFAQTMLPDKSVKIDAKKLAQCKKTVNKINAMPLKCDTVLFKPFTEDRVTDHCVAICFDTKERIRKFCFRSNIYDGSHDMISDTAYYDETGELIYFISESSDHCGGGNEYYYVNDRRIVDYRCEYYCECCEEDLSKEQIDSLSPVVGNLITAKFTFGTPLVNFLHVDTLSKKLKKQFCWRGNYTGTANGVLFYSVVDDNKQITFDIQNTEANLNIECKETEPSLFYDVSEIFHYDIGVYTTRIADGKAKITYIHKQDQSNSLNMEYQGQIFSIGDISGYKFIDGLVFSKDLNDYRNIYQYSSGIREDEEYMILFTLQEIRLKSDSNDSFITLKPNSAIIFTIRR